MSIIEVALQRTRSKDKENAPAPAASGDVQNLGRVLQPSQTLALDLTQLEAAGFLPPADQRRRQMHEYRTIKRALLDAAADETLPMRNVIMVTSALSGDGKTYTTFNLARSMALELDRRVLLIDADVLRRGLSSALGLENAPGLVDLLCDERIALEDVVVQTADANLCILPAGRVDENVNELLASDRMPRVISRLSNAFPRQITLFDSPPLLLTSEAGTLAGFAGQIVLVVRAFLTGQDNVRAALARLDPGKRISAIFNAWQPSGPFEKHYGAAGLYYGADESQTQGSKSRR